MTCIVFPTAIILLEPVSRFGDVFEDELRDAGVTCGHWPQSMALSTVGGWLACRGAGQLSTRYGKIEDMVLSLTLATPAGIVETRLTPASAAGPGLLQMVIGSEGIFGVITRAVMKPTVTVCATGCAVIAGGVIVPPPPPPPDHCGAAVVVSTP